jgi:DNA polymerase-2
MSSVPGIYDWVVVLDFKSLYPSVMRTFNIDPLDHRPDCTARTGEKLLKSPNNTCFVDRNGILPNLLQQIWEQRDAAKKRNDQVASLAFKTLMNSFFGVMASPNCRFFSMKLANAITHFARHFIQLIIDEVEKKGYSVIYGDTDSIFVNLAVESQEEAEKVATEIQDTMNEFLIAHIQKEYGRHSFLELEFEKTYKKFLMPRVRGREEGSKKRYAGLKVWGDEEKMDFTGLEFVRRDWTDLSKEFQLTLYDKVFHDEPVEKYVKDFVKDLQAGKYDDLLVYKKAVRKELKAYVKTTPPHVKAARILVEKEGKLQSNIIEYVITEHGPEPVEHTSASLDYEHYLDKQVRPIADAILCFFDTNLDEVMKGSSQMTLGGF